MGSPEAGKDHIAKRPSKLHAPTVFSGKFEHVHSAGITGDYNYWTQFIVVTQHEEDAKRKRVIAYDQNAHFALSLKEGDEVEIKGYTKTRSTARGARRLEIKAMYIDLLKSV